MAQSVERWLPKCEDHKSWAQHMPVAPMLKKRDGEPQGWAGSQAS